MLEQADHARTIAEECVHRDNWLYLGRGYNYPVALEGALKLKEISYIHAEGLPAAEMKHGPIALINDGMPVVVIATDGPQYEKIRRQHRGGPRPRRPRHRHRHRRQPADPRSRSKRLLRPRRARAAPAPAHRPAAPANRLPRPP